MSANEPKAPETEEVPETGDWREVDRLERAAILGRGGEDVEDEPGADAPEWDLKGWPPAWRRDTPPRDLFGLALSGGGIRSATFNLGLLQELGRQGLLECFDYLSTVSGGGYIGGFWSAWRARRKEGSREVFPGSNPRLPEPREVRHLREFSNFLRPRSSLFDIETARIVSALISGVVPCIVLAFAVLLALLGGWWILIWWFTGAGPGGLEVRLWKIPLAPAVLYGAVTGLILWLTERWLWIRSKPSGRVPTPAERGSYRPWAIVATLLASLAAGALWYVAPSPAVMLLGIPAEELAQAVGIALTPALPWLAVTLLFLGARTTGGRLWSHDWEGRAKQAAVDRTMTRLFLTAAVWTVLAAAWAVGQVLAQNGVSGLAAAFGTGGTAGGLFAWLRHRLLARGSEPAAGNVALRLGTFLYRLLAYVALVAVAAGAAALIVVVFSELGRGWLVALGIATVAVLILCLLIDPHEIGLHKFYRARLVRAYLGPSNPAAWPRETAEAEGDDLSLTDLPERPFHLICCAANDLAGDPLGSLGRGAESAVASRLGLQVGGRFRRWQGRKEKAPWLSDVLTASGAAFNSHMGAVSARLGKAVTFLLTAIGLRLGLWVENPRHEATAAAADAGEKEPDGGPNKKKKERKKRAPGYLFLRELFSDSRADARWIHLSDGAHFENLALYELVRRHCRFILVSDCAADPDRAFDDFANAVRRVREDFGVEIEIDVSPLQPDPETGKARQPMVAGDIRYPATKPGGEGKPGEKGKSGEKGDVGVLLYLKPTLTGKEPPDVAQYAERNERFPHETTIDQFYDEAQWESYRRLGCHAVREALRPVEGYLPHKETSHVAGGTCRAAHLFVRARYYWPPRPDEEPNLDRLEKEWAALENRLLLAPRDGGKITAGVKKLGGQLSLLAGDAGVKASDTELVDALPAVREAIRLMEQVCLRTGFARDDRAASNRLYMGWFNRFGLWATAPIFRAWWPWLAPFHSGDFVGFMEGIDELGLLPTVPRGKKTVLQATKELPNRGEPGEAAKSPPIPSPVALELRPQPSGGYARSRFEARTRDGAGKGAAEIYELYLAMPHTEKRLNAAVLRLTVEPRNLEDGRTQKVARWSPNDLFVPPGLWAIGVGERFVYSLIEELPKRGFRRIEVDASGGQSISEDALYTGAGFSRRPDGGYERELPNPS